VSLTIIILQPSWLVPHNVAIGLCCHTWSHNSLSHVVVGSVIRWYRVQIGGGWGWSLAGRCISSIVTVIFLLVIFGVIGMVSGGMFAHGWLLCW